MMPTDDSSAPSDPVARDTSGCGSPALSRIHSPAIASQPDDLGVPWGWSELFLFVVLYFIGMFAVGILVAVGFVASGATLDQLRNSGPNQALFLLAVQGLLSVLTLAYLASQVRIGYRLPFWRTIGWRPFPSLSVPRGGMCSALILLGCLLSYAVQLASSAVGTKAKLPMETIFQDQRSMLLLAAMAVTIAPVVEETMFRGYIFPVVARSFGRGAGVIATGVLFGLLHAQQLWGGWVQIGLMIFVGMAFTLARSVTRTVLASYILHVSYNFLPSLAALLGAYGLLPRPAGH